EFRQLDIDTSISLYFPPMGTAGLARSSVNGKSREPLPPPIIILTTFLLSIFLNFFDLSIHFTTALSTNSHTFPNIVLPNDPKKNQAASPGLAQLPIVGIFYIIL